MKTKNLKVLAMILLISTLLILAASASVPNVKAATTETTVLFSTLGTQSVTANGTAMTAGASTTFTSGNTETFQATAASGFQFLFFMYSQLSGPTLSTDNPFSQTISAPGSLEAIFVPTSNTTAATSGSGASTLAVFSTAGGSTSPAGSTSGASVSATIGQPTTITQTPGTGFKFLCWVVEGTSNNDYTSSSLTYTPTSSGAALEAIWIPTSSSVTLPSTSPTPTINEFSSAMVVILAAVLVATTVGTYTYTKKTKK